MAIESVIVTHATTRVNPEDVMLGEVSQTQEDRQRMMPITGGP